MRHGRGGKHRKASEQPATASSSNKEVIFKVNRPEEERRTERKRRRSPDSESDRRKRRRESKSSRDKYANHPSSSKFGAEYSSDITGDGPVRDELESQMQSTTKVAPG